MKANRASNQFLQFHVWDDAIFSVEVQILRVLHASGDLVGQNTNHLMRVELAREGEDKKNAEI